MIRRACFALVLWLAAPALAFAWIPAESTRHYAISGADPLALYKDIGRKGPKTSTGTRAIAVTNWDLKWRRDYRPKGDGCVVASALPFLTITYSLPKPAQKLSGETARRWQRFYDGIKVHEDYHGTLLIEMTQAIIDGTVGLSTATDDRKCSALRARVLEVVSAAFAGYKRDSAAFDRMEMRPGGNVHSLVLDLVRP